MEIARILFQRTFCIKYCYLNRINYDKFQISQTTLRGSGTRAHLRNLVEKIDFFTQGTSYVNLHFTKQPEIIIENPKNRDSAFLEAF